MGCWLKLREMIPQPERVEPLVFGFYSLEQQDPGSQDLNCSLWLCQCSSGAWGTEQLGLPALQFLFSCSEFCLGTVGPQAAA